MLKDMHLTPDTVLARYTMTIRYIDIKGKPAREQRPAHIMKSKLRIQQTEVREQKNEIREVKMLIRTSDTSSNHHETRELNRV
jgi:hypothetical protein